VDFAPEPTGAPRREADPAALPLALFRTCSFLRLKKRSRVRFRLALASPLRRAVSLISFHRPPAASRRQRQTKA